MTRHPVAIVGALTAALMLERWAYHASTSFLTVWMVNDLGATLDETLVARMVMTVGGTLGTLLGGVLALGVGPRLTAALGALFAAVGHSVLCFMDTGPPTFGVALLVGGARAAWEGTDVSAFPALPASPFAPAPSSRRANVDLDAHPRECRRSGSTTCT